jgi:hypothetical protein
MSLVLQPPYIHFGFDFCRIKVFMEQYFHFPIRFHGAKLSVGSTLPVLSILAKIVAREYRLNSSEK